MTTDSLVARYALAPDAIEPLRHARLTALLDLPADLPGPERELLTRIAYAAGDPTLARDVRLTSDAIAAGVAALRAGRPIITDVKMARAGIDRRLSSGLGCRVLCAIDHPTVQQRAAQSRLPRAVEAMRYLAPELEGAVVAIGNAPTALLALLDLIDAGVARPALVVGAPVGFVAAVEAKEELLRRNVPYVAVTGTRGGSAVAAAVVNTLLRAAHREQGVSAGKTAVLFLGHGSRRAAAGAAMETVLDLVRARGGYDIVERGYLEFVSPTIQEGVRACVEQGATRIIGAPYFLHVGMHMIRDLPRELRVAQQTYPDVAIVLGRHMGLHLDIVEIMLDRIAESWRLPLVDQVEFTAAYFNGVAEGVGDAPVDDDH